MLNNIMCEKFVKKEVIFHPGLNTVIGDNIGSNSIGKSTFLMIIDFVFGGKDYILKSTDVQRNIGDHIIKFSFEFNNKRFYFLRNTGELETVSICDNNYNIVENITLDKYNDFLKEKYEIKIEGLSFRDAVGRYSRVYGKDNLNEKKPLDIVRNESAGNPIKAILKLFDLYNEIKELEELAKRKRDEHTIFKKAQKYSYIPNINKREKIRNEKKIQELAAKKEKIVNELDYGLLDLESAKTDEVLYLKSQLSLVKRKISKLSIQQKKLQVSNLGNILMNEDDRDELKRLFPEIDVRTIEEIEGFHKDIQIVLIDEINEELTNVNMIMDVAYQEKEELENSIKSISDSYNLSEIILFKYAEYQKEVEKLERENNGYEELISLKTAKKDAENRRDKMKREQLDQLEREINSKMESLNDIIYNKTKKPPVIKFDKNNYLFETVDDTGTGTSYRSMVIFDLTVLQLTPLPILIHDSVLLKQIEDFAVERILKMYQESKKQIFIAFDKMEAYTQKSQTILQKSKVLELEPNGKELYGVSWNKKS